MSESEPKSSLPEHLLSLRSESSVPVVPSVPQPPSSRPSRSKKSWLEIFDEREAALRETQRLLELKRQNALRRPDSTSEE